MKKKWFLISGLLAVFLFSGCAGLFEEERTALVSANIELRKELVKRETSLEYNQKLVSESKKEISEMEVENEQLTKQVQELKDRIENKKSGNEESDIQVRTEIKKTEAKAGVRNKPLRIKILAAAKQADKAKGLSDKLTGLGYKIERIERATKPFTRTTVYHASGVTREAKDMAKKLGANTVIKPISWKTVFNVIIAVGTAK